MSESIEILNQKETGQGWDFEVRVGGSSQFTVTVDSKDYERITNKKIQPNELVKRSFEFLLEREPKEAILRKFNIRVISTYFPEYENVISQSL